MASSNSKASKGKNKSTKDNWASNLDYDDVLDEIKSRSREGEVERFQDFVRTSYIEQETVVEKYKSFLGKAAKASSEGRSADDQRRVQDKMRETAVTQLFAALGYGPKPTVIEQSDPIESLLTRLRVPSLGSLTSGEPSGSAGDNGPYERGISAAGAHARTPSQTYVVNLVLEGVQKLAEKERHGDVFAWAKERSTRELSGNQPLFDAFMLEYASAQVHSGHPTEPFETRESTEPFRRDALDYKIAKDLQIDAIADKIGTHVAMILDRERRYVDDRRSAIESHPELSSPAGVATHAALDPVLEKLQRMSLTRSDAADPRSISSMPMVSPADARAMLLHVNASQLLAASSIPRTTDQVTVPIPGPEWAKNLTADEVRAHLNAAADYRIKKPPWVQNEKRQATIENDTVTWFRRKLGDRGWEHRIDAARQTVDFLQEHKPHIWDAMTDDIGFESDADKSAEE